MFPSPTLGFPSHTAVFAHTSNNSKSSRWKSSTMAPIVLKQNNILISSTLVKIEIPFPLRKLKFHPYHNLFKTTFTASLDGTIFYIIVLSHYGIALKESSLLSVNPMFLFSILTHCGKERKAVKLPLRALREKARWATFLIESLKQMNMSKSFSWGPLLSDFCLFLLFLFFFSNLGKTWRQSFVVGINYFNQTRTLKFLVVTKK